jgi:hypothetical protein
LAAKVQEIVQTAKFRVENLDLKQCGPAQCGIRCAKNNTFFKKSLWGWKKLLYFAPAKKKESEV